MNLKNKTDKELWDMLDKYDELKSYVHNEIGRRAEGKYKYNKNRESK